MKQTNYYKLNLIETSDRFSPDPLNENTRLLEQALNTVSAGTDAEARARAAADTTEAQARAAAVNSEAQTRAAADSALSSRVAALELHKIAVGSYTGSGTASRTIKLSFTPSVVFLGYSGMTTFAVSGAPQANVLEIVSGGFKASGAASATVGASSGVMYGNSKSAVYRYAAFC